MTQNLPDPTPRDSAQLPPNINPWDHPELTMRWTAPEIKWIQVYATNYAREALRAQAASPADMAVYQGIADGYTRDAQAASVEAVGLSLQQEPKYTTDGKHLINRHSSELIPSNEPVFVFRARDALAVKALRGYMADILAVGRAPQNLHAEAVARRIADFERFATANPDRMKWPDTIPADVSPPQAPQAVVEVLTWAVSRWRDEVQNRPMVNKNRRTLDDTWRQVIRFAGGDPDQLVGPSHDALLASQGGAQ